MASDDYEEGQVVRIGQVVETTTAQPVRPIKGGGQSIASPSRSFGTGTVGRECWTLEILPPSDADGSFTVVLDRENVLAEAETYGDAWVAFAEWALDKSDE